VYVAGERRSFPIFPDAAYDNAERAIHWEDAPFSGEIMDELDDREVMLGSIVQVYTALAKRDDGTLYFTDDDGHGWGILARMVTAVEVEDPQATDRKRRPSLGFPVD
jgi:hypothetical protein